MQKPLPKSFEHLYLEERKRAQNLMALSVVLAIVLVGFIIHSISISSGTKSPSQTASGINTQGGSAMVGPGTGSGGKMLMPSDSAVDYLNEDGSVNENLIQSNVQSKQAPPSMLEAMLRARELQVDEALARSEINSQQASALKEAWQEAVRIYNAN